ncbi:MAG TPA: hypothetical protein VHB46_19610 [Burkholderiales bacterium]|nr:hypothetical protein [Burkholderiales bacterium]
MNRSSPDSHPIENAADYIDALLRPKPDEKRTKWKFIEGRRMRDKFLDQVIVPDNVEDKHSG